ncbi:flavodoxin [Planococcus antarcticus DSM 14505]|uniref:Flavodoxin n=1 Tax=Planococcus antarcticus DSM 14505 TaxID=1185653 RepID=A0A1C7DDJ3_9BACL|nr:flavodoxin domain-containing protein [Planococcus antarcticus]ANU09556.1 flavodoxin [Planococcus antarcticus DSM 14505]EIM08241.1 flavodoxin [Planococcus antarcticus DSM 14505]
MALTNYRPKRAIVYTSVTGNTEQLAEMLQTAMLNQGLQSMLYRIEDFPLTALTSFDTLLIGTYTWGSGEIPEEMRDLYEAIERLDRKELQTAAFGTGDSFFAEFCGAVDRFRDMLYMKTQLVATLKVELMPQPSDSRRCEKLVELIKLQGMQLFFSEDQGDR